MSITEDNQQSIFNQDGSRLLCVGTNTLSLYDFKNNDLVSLGPRDQIMIASLSPTGNYAAIMERRSKELHILRVLHLPSFQPILSFPYKSYFKEHWPLIQFDSKDNYCYRVNNDQHSELEVYCLQSGQLVNSHPINHTVDQVYLSPDKFN